MVFPARLRASARWPSPNKNMMFGRFGLPPCPVRKADAASEEAAIPAALPRNCRLVELKWLTLEQSMSSVN
jgi:hypothetical protein